MQQLGAGHGIQVADLKTSQIERGLRRPIIGEWPVERRSESNGVVIRDASLNPDRHIHDVPRHEVVRDFEGLAGIEDDEPNPVGEVSEQNLCVVLVKSHQIDQWVPVPNQNHVALFAVSRKMQDHRPVLLAGDDLFDAGRED
jgi:hypothetical protein